MANKSLFKSTRGRTVPKTNAVNSAGGKAYELSAKAALARYAMTGCMSNTYYVKAENHLATVLDLAGKCEPKFIAQLAVYSRKHGFMKDMPALLCAHLTTRGEEGAKMFRLAFPKAIDNGTMLRNFLQIMRSGTVGRKSLGYGPKKLCKSWLESNHPTWLFRQLAVQHGEFKAKDIISMIHPNGKQASKGHDALFGYWLGKVKPESEKWNDLPPVVHEFEEWKKNRDLPPPKVDFRLLDSQKMTPEQWAKVIRQQNWHAVKKNINTAIRNGALKADKQLGEFMADRIKDQEIIKRARVMPSDLLSAYKYIDHKNTPRVIIDALHDAMELAVLNAPVAEGRTLVIVDVSGSMSWSMTGGHGNTVSKVRCIDVAALFATAMARNNRDSIILPVDTRVHTDYRPEPRNTVLSEAERLAKYGGGGTALSAALFAANISKLKVDNVIVLSDQESWADSTTSIFIDGRHAPHGTKMMVEWEKLSSRNKGCKMVCVDIVPGTTHQTIEGRKDILHVSGWNDSVFRVIETYLSGDTDSWLSIIESVEFEVS